MTIILGKKQGIYASRASCAVREAEMLTDARHRRDMEESGGWIYAAVEDETPLVKIGYTRAGTHERLRLLAYALQTAVTLVAVVIVPRDITKIERHVHALLAGQCIEGEWFYTHMNQDMLAELVLQAQQRLRLQHEAVRLLTELREGRRRVNLHS